MNYFFKKNKAKLVGIFVSIVFLLIGSVYAAKGFDFKPKRPVDQSCHEVCGEINAGCFDVYSKKEGWLGSFFFCDMQKEEAYIFCGCNCLSGYIPDFENDTCVLDGPPTCGDNAVTEECDFDPEICEIFHGSNAWSLSTGNSTSACWMYDECCGDDSLEYYEYRLCDNAYACTSSTSDDACCNSSGYCVDSGTCYIHTATHDVDANGDVEYCSSSKWYDCTTTAHCDPVGEYAYTETNNPCISGECNETCSSNDCIYRRYDGQGDCDNNNGCVGSCIQDPDYDNLFIGTGMCDNNVGAICTGGASDGYDVCVSAGSCLIDHDRDDAMADCTGSNCIVADMGTFDVDGDGDLDTCNLGVWLDCTIDAHCGFCEQCSSNNCVYSSTSQDPKGGCGTAGCLTGFCNGAGACNKYTVGQQNCGECNECNVSGICVEVTDMTDPYNDCGLCGTCDIGECHGYASGGTDVEDECGTTGCGTGYCSGTGYTCAYYTSGQQNCGECRECNSIGNCTNVADFYDPWDDCGLCGFCDGGECMGYTGAGDDYEDECSVGSWSCSGDCVRLRTSDYCSGTGYTCGVESDDIDTGYVCTGAGTQTAVSSSNNCLYWENCDDGDCSATRYYNSCNGTGACRSSGDTTNAATASVEAEAGYSLTSTCGMEGTSYCSSLDNCSGDTRYTGYKCDGGGACDVSVGDIGCCTHYKCTGVGDDFCQYYNTGDENRSTSPAHDGDAQSGVVQLASRYICAPAKYFNRGTEASSTDGINLNTAYTRHQTYTGDIDWWQFGGDGMITAQTSYTPSQTDLCFVYNYDPCTLSATSDVVARNAAGTRYDLGDIKQDLSITAGCSSNWIWIDLAPYLGASTGIFQIAAFSGDSDYIREWQFGWETSEVGLTDGVNSTWCCDSSTDCVDDAPTQGNRVSGDPDSTSSGCYNTGTNTRDADGDGDLDYCNSGSWADCGDDTHCGFCERCEANNCVYSNLAQDPKEECGTAGCLTGFCNNAGACDLYDAGQRNCGTCELCNASGVCTGQTAYYATATALGCTAGDEGCRYCSAGECMNYIDGQRDCLPCKYCSAGGACINVAEGSNDEFGSCNTNNCSKGYCDGAGGCDYFTDNLKHNCPTCFGCNASGTCFPQTADYSVATDLGCTAGDEGCRYCNAGTCGYYPAGQEGCGLCKYCNPVGSCVNVAEGVASGDCSTVNCQTGNCDGYAACEKYTSGQQNCGECDECNDLGNCTQVATAADPWDSCGLCGICDLGDCIGYAQGGTDVENECSVGSWSCSGQCVRLRNSGFCAGGGVGACGVNDESDNIDTGYVCTGAGVQTAVSPSNYCNYDEDCDDSDCWATRYYTSCNSSGACRIATDHTNAATVTVDADAGYSLTSTCGMQGTAYCSSTDNCSGSTRYTGYKCDGGGECDVSTGDIGCCTDAKCSTYFSCDQSATSTDPYQCDTCWNLTRGTFDTTSRASGNPASGDMCYNTDLIDGTSNTCLMYNINDTEDEATDAKIYIGKTYFSDTVASGDNYWAYYKWHDISSAVIGDVNLIEFDDNQCCWTLDEVLVGWKISESGAAADGSSSTSCCDHSTDCVDDYVMGSYGTAGTWGCYNSGTHTHDASGSGDDDYCSSGNWLDCYDTGDCDPAGEYAYTESSNACASGTDCHEACTSNDCIYHRYEGWSDCDNDNGCYNSNCIQNEAFGITFAGTGWPDSLDNIFVDGALDHHDICVGATSCLIDHDYDYYISDCSGADCIRTNGQTFDSDQDGDLDYCDNGVWIDCTIDAHCDTGEYCSNNDCEDCACSSGACCDGCHYRSSSYTCREGEDDCDVEEKCTGSSTTCPTDSYKESGIICRSAAGLCDMVEYCTGLSGTCPTDSFKHEAWICRLSVGFCDFPEYCNGLSIDCVTDEGRDDGAGCGQCRYCQNRVCVNVSPVYGADIDPNNQCGTINCFTGDCSYEGDGFCSWYTSEQNNCSYGFMCEASGSCIKDPSVDFNSSLEQQTRKISFDENIYYGEAIGFSPSDIPETAALFGSVSGDVIIDADITLFPGAYLIWGESNKLTFNSGKITLFPGAAMVRAGEVISGAASGVGRRACICVRDDPTSYLEGAIGVLPTTATAGLCSAAVCPTGTHIADQNIDNNWIYQGFEQKIDWWGNLFEWTLDVRYNPETYATIGCGDGPTDIHSSYVVLSADPTSWVSAWCPFCFWSGVWYCSYEWYDLITGLPVYNTGSTWGVDVCYPDCDGKNCGPDGCSGSCGTCDILYFCVGGICEYEGGETGCFDKESLLTLNNGQTKKINDIKTGDKILGWDFNLNKKVITQVRDLLIHDNSFKKEDWNLSRIAFSSGTVINSTQEHKIYTLNKEWILVGELEIGDIVLNILNEFNQQDIVIDIRKDYQQEKIVYNLETTTQNYFVSGILVHNEKPIPE